MRQLMKGNDAIAEAAVRAGMRFFSGYPITPQTEILEYLSKRLPEVGGTFVQTESEISGISMVYGAAATGFRTMTSSSGPGFSLLQEGISYIASAELPCVIVDVMRYGTGLGDIFQAQGDYLQVVKNGGHGDYRCLVYAPSSVQEAADLMTLAFDKAEEHRNPVILLSDASISQIPAALANTVNGDNAASVKAGLVVEAANIAVSPEADEILKKRGVRLICDFTANLSEAWLYDAVFFGAVTPELSSVLAGAEALCRRNAAKQMRCALEDGIYARESARELFEPDVQDLPEI